MKKSKREEVYKKFNQRCSYCGKKIDYKDMQVDHYYPKSDPWYAKSYLNVDVNDMKNLMPSCRRCNHYKRSYLPEDFRRLMKTLHKRIEKNYIAKVAIDYGIVSIKPFDGIFYFEKLNK